VHREVNGLLLSFAGGKGQRQHSSLCREETWDAMRKQSCLTEEGHSLRYDTLIFRGKILTVFTRLG